MTTTAQWIAAWGTLGGAAATFAAVVLGFFGLRGELRRAIDQRALDREQRALDAEQRQLDAAARRNREAAQARLVLVVVHHVAAPDGHTLHYGPGAATPAQGRITVEVSNASQQPLRSLELHHVQLHTPDPRLPNALTTPEDYGWETLGTPLRAGPVLAGEQRRWDVVIREPVGSSGSTRRGVLESDQYVATVIYTDVDGLRWKRTMNCGELREPDPLAAPFGA